MSDDLSTIYLRASATRQIPLPSAGFGWIQIPYMEHGWVYLLELPNLPGEQIRVFIEHQRDYTASYPLAVIVNANGETLARGRYEENSLSGYSLEVTIGDSPATLMLGLDGWQQNPPYYETEFTQMWITVEHVPITLPETTPEPDLPTLTNTPLPTFTPTLTPLVPPQHVSPTPMDDAPESVDLPPTLTPMPTP
jgi:hypothetical protein